LALMYVLAVPAFNEMDESKIFATGKYSVKFVDQSGREIGQRGILHNDAVPLDDIPDHLIKATLATEDRRFFEHYGIDVLGTLRALATNLNAGETVQGGSTLTQQLAKNLFLSSERSLTRKLKELFLSFWLEAKLTKRQILKLYFDRAYMGGGAFGVEAAAQFYFGKSVRDVTLPEAAMMAGLFKAPTKYAPHIDLPAARARANEVLSNLVEAGFLTAGQVQSARLNPAKPIDSRMASSPDWYLDWAFEEVQRIAEGRGYYVLTARVAVDLRLQQAAEQALLSTLGQEGKAKHAKAGALVAMEPDGAVRAMVGGLDYGESQFNRATHARRQPGSSFKLYVYANAVEHGLTPTSTVRDSPVSCGNWSPKNYDGSTGGRGALPMGVAFAKSLNTTAVELSLKYDRENVIKLTQRLGVTGVRKTCSMALGDGGVTVLEHTGAYATYANGGKLAKPYAVIELLNSRGEVVYSRDHDEPAARQVVKPEHAASMNQMMHMVVTEGTGKRAALDFTHVAGKTGTSSSYRDAWFMGFTGDYVTGVWIGNDDFRPMDRVTGGGIPASAWHSFMAVAHSSMNIKQIPGLPLHPTQVAERARIEELRRSQPQLAQDLATGAKGRDRLMSERMRETLRTVARSMRLAGGIPEPPPEERLPAAPVRANPSPAQGASPSPAPAPTDSPSRQRKAGHALPVGSPSEERRLQ
ncbi:MAG: transglycosylase domain-containing protein, partial [Hyphomicrobiaceae bacterium]